MGTRSYAWKQIVFEIGAFALLTKNTQWWTKKNADTLACSAKFLGKRFGNILAMKNINLKVNGSSASLVANLQLTQLLIYVSLVTHCHLFCLLLFFVFIVCH